MKLYTDILMWKSEEWDDPMPYWMLTTGKNEGINEGLSMVGQK